MTKKIENPFGKPVSKESENTISVNIKEALAPQTMEEGEYQAVFRGVMQGLTKNGDDALKFKFVVVDEPYIGREFILTKLLRPDLQWAIKLIADALEIEPDEDGNVQFDPEALEDHVVIVTIENKEYQGKEYSNVSKVLPHPNGAKAYITAQALSKNKAKGKSKKEVEENDVEF